MGELGPDVIGHITITAKWFTTPRRGLSWGTGFSSNTLLESIETLVLAQEQALKDVE